MKQVAIQGLKGSFHDIAAHQFFQGDELDIICCATFEQVFKSVKDNGEAIALLAIENTIAGSLLHNYELLRDSGLSVVGEHKLHIEHCICCLPEDDWETIEEIHSHPVALMQCRQFLANYPKMKVVEDEDTAGSAKYIGENKKRGWAAICHAEAAKLYGLKVLQNSIEDNKHNFTRFLVAVPQQHADQMRNIYAANKASIVFTLPHEEGSLSAILSILSFYKTNLTKIQSLPIIGHEWEYMFIIDLKYTGNERFHLALEAIKPLTSKMRLLGQYSECNL
ncbi:MAG: prephenate dehydratase [Bacteroidaceae bacterium]|nr:prephenate dehydratase [Bacteroidaceae bacterium]